MFANNNLLKNWAIQPDHAPIKFQVSEDPEKAHREGFVGLFY